MLIWIDTEYRWSRHHCHHAFQMSRFPQQAARGDCKNQFGLAIFELGRGIDADRKVPGAIGLGRRLRGLPNAILDAILFDKGCDPANSTGIAYVDSNGRGLAECGNGRGQVHNRRS